jgi:NACHT domain
LIQHSSSFLDDQLLTCSHFTDLKLHEIGSKTLAAITDQNVKTNIQNTNARARECHQVFKTSGYEEHKNRNLDRVEGTCQWVINDPLYQSWLASTNDDLLLITADPGCGKSVLSKSLIDGELKSQGPRSTCYFFFKDNDDQNSLSDALCSLLHQLFTYRPHLLSYATPFFDRNGNNLQKETAQLWEILLQATTDPDAGDVVCILDALDECALEGQVSLIDFLTTFYNSSTMKTSRGSTLKFLVTSRPYNNIERGFYRIRDGLETIRLAGEEENKQISTEINAVIRCHRCLDLRPFDRVGSRAKPSRSFAITIA